VKLRNDLKVDISTDGKKEESKGNNSHVGCFKTP
jgi:hypothetical protein